MKTFKVVLIGDGGVGKTTFIRRHLTAEFEKRYIATLGVDVNPLRFMTNYGPVCLNIWDCAGQEKFGGLRDGYFVQAHACVVMFDRTSKNTLKNVPKWLLSFVRMMGNDTPIVICGSKVDVTPLKVSKAKITQTLDEIRKALPNVLYFDISSKSNHNYEKPFLEICRSLMGKDDLVFLLD